MSRGSRYSRRFRHSGAVFKSTPRPNPRGDFSEDDSTPPPASWKIHRHSCGSGRSENGARAGGQAGQPEKGSPAAHVRIAVGRSRSSPRLLHSCPAIQHPGPEQIEAGPAPYINRFTNFQAVHDGPPSVHCSAPDRSPHTDGRLVLPQPARRSSTQLRDGARAPHAPTTCPDPAAGASLFERGEALGQLQTPPRSPAVPALNRSKSSRSIDERSSARRTTRERCRDRSEKLGRSWGLGSF